MDRRLETVNSSSEQGSNNKETSKNLGPVYDLTRENVKKCIIAAYTYLTND